MYLFIISGPGVANVCNKSLHFAFFLLCIGTEKNQMTFDVLF